MSAASDCRLEAENLGSAAAEGAAAWNSWGRTYCQDLATNRKMLMVRITLGAVGNDWDDYRDAFREAAEEDGFTTDFPLLNPVLAANEFRVRWDNA